MKFPLFERAIAKIAEGRQVTDAERASVRCLLKPVVDHANNDNDDVLDEGDMRVLVNNDECGDHPIANFSWTAGVSFSKHPLHHVLLCSPQFLSQQQAHTRAFLHIKQHGVKLHSMQ